MNLDWIQIWIKAGNELEHCLYVNVLQINFDIETKLNVKYLLFKVKTSPILILQFKVNFFANLILSCMKIAN